jgi:LysR family hydrogen peroxide-inducible transcriptional activator
MSGPLHIGLIPTVGPYLLPHIIPMLHQTFPKLEMYLHEAQTHQLLAQLDSGKLDCAILALVKESEAFIEVPLFDEPMMLAIYEDHPWANRDRVPMADLAGEKLLMLEDGHCLRDQAMGFCFEAGADEDTHFRATSLETLRNMVAAGSGITLLPALAVPRSVNVMAWSICRALSRSRVVRSAWFIVRVHRCAAAMSSWQRPSVVRWMAISTAR